MISTTLAALHLLPALALAVTPNPGPSLSVTRTTVNAGSGDQFDPSVSGDLTAYSNSVSGSTTIHYFDFAAGEDHEISNLLPGGARSYDYLSDINGSTVVFTRVVSGKLSINAFDVSTSGPVIELDPTSGSKRAGAAIGGKLVAWVDFGLGAGSEIVLYHLGSGAKSRLTSDALYDLEPAVSPSGSVVAFQKCVSPISTCDIYQAVSTGADWVVSQVTSTPERESSPDTNGTVVVYDAIRAESSTGKDIYWTPVAGGAEQQLALPGEQRNPNISGGLIAFESIAPGDDFPDLFVYDLSSNNLYRLTNTPSGDEFLNDISLTPSGLIRVVWMTVENDANVYSLSFTPPQACQPTGCAGPGSRPLLASLGLTRTTGAPNQGSAAFSGSGPGLLCVRNGAPPATAGLAWLNGVLEVEDALGQEVTTVERRVALSGSNLLQARIMGKPGTKFEVQVYGADPNCASSSSSSPISGEQGDTRAIRELEQTQISAEEGRLARPPPALGCSAGSGGWVLSGLIAMAIFLLLRPRKARLPAWPPRR